MKYRDEGDYPGTVPGLGSIFMSNAATRKECLELKLLGLPSGQANFVKCVRAGMILFLFEFESRELHGVYRADSDGAMNIVPHAFESSGKQFPAQVRFSVIWDCMPLSEHEFRDAIRKNYYSKKKFNFGLSEDQVRRLLCLFSSRKIVNGVPRREIGRHASLNREQERVYRNKKSSSRQREEKLIERYSPTKPISIKYGHTSPGDGEIQNASSFPENSLGYDRIKGVVDDSMNSIEAKTESGYDMHHNSRDSFYSSMRLSKDNQFLQFDTVHSEHTGNTITPDKTDEFLARPRRESVQLRGIRGNKHALIHDGFPIGKSVESFGIPQTELRRPLDDQRLLTNVDHGHYLFGGPKPANSGRQLLNHLAKVRETSIDDDRLYVNNRIEIGHVVDNSIRPIISNKLDIVGMIADEKRKMISEPVASSLGYGRNPNYGGDNNMLSKSNSVDNAYAVGENFRFPLSERYADLHQLRQQPINSSKTTSDAHYSLSQNQHNTSSKQNVYGKFYPTSLVMETKKYEVSNPTSREVLTQGSSRSAQDFGPYHGHVDNNISAFSKTSLYRTETEDFSLHTNGALNRASEVHLHDNEDLYKESRSSLRGEYRGKMEQPLIRRENYENPMTSFRSPIHERRHISPSVEFDKHLVTSQGRFNHEIQGNVFGPASSDDQDLMMNYGKARAHSRSSCENSYGIGSYKDTNYSEKKPSDFKTRRSSVFARLSVSKSGLEHEGHVKDDEMDVSVDQVMESLRESLSGDITYVTDRSSLVNRNERRNLKYNQIEVDEPAMMTRKVEIECKPDMEAGENDDDVLRETRGVDFKRRSETKRKRGGEKTTGFAESAKGSCGDLKAEKKGEGMRIKRRKLVRPSFGEKKELNNNDKRDELPDSQLLTHESSNNNKAVSGQSPRNHNCPSLNCDASGKLVRPVLGDKEVLRDDSEGDGVSHLPLPTHESSNNNKVVSGQSKRNPNCPYPLRDDSEGDGVSELPLPTHQSLNDSKAATCDYSGKTPGHPSSP